MTVFADYCTVSGRSVTEFRIKGSRFIGVAVHCTSGDAIKPLVSEVVSEYPGADHYCYAAVFGGNDRREKSNDAGEPPGTAAKPILSAIRGRVLTDTLVVVVRYFGGTLLGTGGLVRAYGKAADDALTSAGTAQVRACSIFRVTIPYADIGRFDAKCRTFCAVPPVASYGAEVVIEAAVPSGCSEEFLAVLRDCTGARASAVHLGQGYRCVS